MRRRVVIEKFMSRWAWITGGFLPRGKVLATAYLPDSKNPDGIVRIEMFEKIKKGEGDIVLKQRTFRKRGYLVTEFYLSPKMASILSIGLSDTLNRKGVIGVVEEPDDSPAT